MINMSPIGRNCSQEERDAFEAYDKVCAPVRLVCIHARWGWCGEHLPPSSSWVLVVPADGYAVMVTSTGRESKGDDGQGVAREVRAYELDLLHRRTDQF
jgi:hypothetical protein|eukprot:COSAG01_NODE_11975_length_1824_cov_2.243478_2_plen_99_part_00